MENVRIAIRDSTDSHNVAFFDNISGIRYQSANLQRFLAGSASILTIEYNSKDIDTIRTGCKLAFIYKGRPYWLNIMDLSKKGYKVEQQSETAGDEAGIRSVSYKISGQNAYGWLKSESGVHRLVRISPYDSAARRHTSFSSVWVYPVVDDNIDIDIPDRDIRIDTYRSSGAGGQHVNTTDSAVRITHLPTNIVVTSSMKSQHQNRDACMVALRARLYQLELDRRNAAVNAQHDSKGDAGWGNQIRSYVLQPYQMVKDLRTGEETSDTAGVLDGDLDRFMAATLAMDVAGKSRAEANADE